MKTVEILGANRFETYTKTREGSRNGSPCRMPSICFQNMNPMLKKVKKKEALIKGSTWHFVSIWL